MALDWRSRKNETVLAIENAQWQVVLGGGPVSTPPSRLVGHTSPNRGSGSMSSAKRPAHDSTDEVPFPAPYTCPHCGRKFKVHRDLVLRWQSEWSPEMGWVEWQERVPEGRVNRIRGHAARAKHILNCRRNQTVKLYGTASPLFQKWR